MPYTARGRRFNNVRSRLVYCAYHHPFLQIIEKVVGNFQDQFVKLGGVLKDKEPVSSISEENDTVIVECESGVCYKGSKLIICAGTWLNRLLAPMGLKLDLRVRIFGSFRLSHSNAVGRLSENEIAEKMSHSN